MAEAGAEQEGESAALPKAGWYPDPGQDGREQLWDGERWRARFRPADGQYSEAIPVGWYTVPETANTERLWDGERWVGSGRPIDPLAVLQDTGVPGPTTRYLDPNPPQPVTLLGRIAVGALALTILIELTDLFFTQRYIGYIGDRVDGRSVDLGSVQTAITDLRTLHIVAAGWLFVTALAFGAWFFRAYRNLVRAGLQDVRFAPGWAIGAWFIPIFNWIRPKAIADDTWRGSEALAARQVEGWRLRPVPSLLHWWWGLWIAGGLVGLFGRGEAKDGETFFAISEQSLRDERTHLYIGQVGTLAGIAAAVLAIFVVQRLSRIQDDALAGVRAGEVVAAPRGLDVAALGLGATKICPECAEEVKAAARKCRYCGYRFAEPA